MSEPLHPISESRVHSESDFPVEFVRQHVSGVFNLIFRIVGNRDEAQELTQETFITVFQRRGAATNLRKAAAALPAIAADIAMHWLWSSGRANEVPELHNPAPSRDLQAVLDHLPAHERTCLLLRDLEGMPIRKISRHTKDSVRGIRTFLGRARLKLRQWLQVDGTYGRTK